MNAPFNIAFASEIQVPSHVSWPAWPWIVLAVISSIEAVWLLATPLQLEAGTSVLLLQIAALSAIGLRLGQRFRHSPRLYSLCMGGAFLFTAWPVLRLFNHLTMTAGMPLADPLLASWDRAIGFDWLGYVRWAESHPLLFRAMDSSYSGLSLYSCVIFLLLCAGRRPEKTCFEMISLFLGTAVICSGVGMFFPAEAALAHYAPDPALFTRMEATTGLYHLDALTRLRGDPAHNFDLRQLPGLVTFPSFHTAMGVVAIYCARGTWWLLWPSLAINLVMIASTPVFGSHYAVDVIAGVAVAGATILTFRFLSSNNTCRIRPGLASSPNGAALPI